MLMPFYQYLVEMISIQWQAVLTFMPLATVFMLLTPRAEITFGGGGLSELGGPLWMKLCSSLSVEIVFRGGVVREKVGYATD